MKADKIRSLLGHLNSKATGNRGDWVESRCPLGPWKHGGADKNPSFGIKAGDHKKSICKCLSCGFGGDLLDLLLEIARLLKKSSATGYNMAMAGLLINAEHDEMELDMASIPEYGESEAKVDSPFPEEWLAMFQPVCDSIEGMEYLRSRNIPLLMVKSLGVVFDPLQNRVGFPFRNREGKLMGLQGRAIYSPAKLRYFQYGYLGTRNAQCWMGENTANLDQPMVLCEGPIDFARIAQHYQNVAASFTSGLSVDKIKRLVDCDTFITFYDHGKGGDAAREKLKKTLPKASFVDIIPTEEEGDAGALKDAKLREYLEPHLTLLPAEAWWPECP